MPIEKIPDLVCPVCNPDTGGSGVKPEKIIKTKGKKFVYLLTQ
jgi:hypothetical protein